MELIDATQKNASRDSENEVGNLSDSFFIINLGYTAQQLVLFFKENPCFKFVHLMTRTCKYIIKIRQNIFYLLYFLAQNTGSKESDDVGAAVSYCSVLLFAFIFCSYK